MRKSNLGLEEDEDKAALKELDRTTLMFVNAGTNMTLAQLKKKELILKYVGD